MFKQVGRRPPSPVLVEDVAVLPVCRGVGEHAVVVSLALLHGGVCEDAGPQEAVRRGINRVQLFAREHGTARRRRGLHVLRVERERVKRFQPCRRLRAERLRPQHVAALVAHGDRNYLPQIRLMLTEIANKVLLVEALHDEQNGRRIAVPARVKRLCVPEIALLALRLRVCVLRLKRIVDHNAASESRPLFPCAKAGDRTADADAVDAAARRRCKVFLPPLSGHNADPGEDVLVKIRTDAALDLHGLIDGQGRGVRRVNPFAVRPHGKPPRNQVARDVGLAVPRRHTDCQVALAAGKIAGDPAKQGIKNPSVERHHDARLMAHLAVPQKELFQARHSSHGFRAPWRRPLSWPQAAS